MGIEVYNRAEAAQLGLKHEAAGYTIPYFTPSGEPTEFFRYRLLEDVRGDFQKLTGTKAPRYLQPGGTAPEVYLPPFAPWADVQTADLPLIITEGEKKAAKATKEGFPTIGLGGVWSFQSKRLGISLLPVLEEFTWSNRPVYIVYDSDAAANGDVRRAAMRLAELLTDRGAKVRVGYLPSEPGEKVGLDDFLVTSGEDALHAWLRGLPLLSECQALHEMNERVTYVFDPGIISVNGTRQQMRPSAFKDHAFSTYTHTITVEKKNAASETKTVSTAAEWLKWPHRSQVQRMEYAPGQPSFFDGRLNLWPGYTVEPAKGDFSPWRELLDFLFQGDAFARSWFERWCAYPLQHPGAKLKTAVLLWGVVRGTGKSAVGETLGKIYGPNYQMITDADLENTTFNSWAHNKQFILADEITGQGNRKLANYLKTLITRTEITINIKHLPQFNLTDCINYLFTSNDPDALYIEPGERRYFVHQVKAEAPLPSAFYDRFHRWSESTEGRAALLHHLLSLPLGDFDPNAHAPRTEAMKSMVEVTRTELETYLIDIMEDPEDTLARYGGGDLISSHEVAAAFDLTVDGKRTSSVLVGRKLKQMGIDPVGRSRVSGGSRVNLYALRNREKWARATQDQIRKHYEKSRNIKE